MVRTKQIIKTVNHTEVNKPTNKSSKTDMVAYAKHIGMKNYSKLNKQELADALGIKGHISGTKKEKNPNHPKRPRTAYIFYTQEKRNALVKKHPKSSFGEIGTLLGKSWNSLDEKDKAKYFKMNTKDKERYEKEMKEYIEKYGEEKKEKKERKGKKEEKKPKEKRARSAYILFSLEKRPQLVKENPTATFGEIGSLLGKAWKELGEKKKEKYIKMNEKEKEEIEKEKKKKEEREKDEYSSEEEKEEPEEKEEGEEEDELKEEEEELEEKEEEEEEPEPVILKKKVVKRGNKKGRK